MNCAPARSGLRLAGLILVGLVGASLFACDRQVTIAAPSTSPQTKAADAGAPSLPPLGPARYVGVWAAAKTACGHAAWHIRKESLETSGGDECAFQKVTPVGGGYDIAATCRSQTKPKSPAQIRLRFADSAGALLIEGGPASSVGLIYCGTLDQYED